MRGGKATQVLYLPVAALTIGSLAKPFAGKMNVERFEAHDVGLLRFRFHFCRSR